MRKSIEECRHFNGIQHETCLAGVRYRDVRDASGPGMARWPCLTLSARPPCTTVCEKRDLLTADEIAARDREIMEASTRAVEAIAAGKCHVCGARVESRRVVPPCAYAVPCGHRIGQVLP